MVGEFKVRMCSAEYGVVMFGPYATIQEARKVCARLRLATDMLGDGVQRELEVSFSTRGRRIVSRAAEGSRSRWSEAGIERL